MARKPLSPLRRIVGREPSPEHPSVVMDRLECGHLMTHDGEANRTYKRRCPACRIANADLFTQLQEDGYVLARLVPTEAQHSDSEGGAS